jgi:hypothetical protein
VFGGQLAGIKKAKHFVEITAGAHGILRVRSSRLLFGGA